MQGYSPIPRTFKCCILFGTSPYHRCHGYRRQRYDSTCVGYSYQTSHPRSHWPPEHSMFKTWPLWHHWMIILTMRITRCAQWHPRQWTPRSSLALTTPLFVFGISALARPWPLSLITRRVSGLFCSTPLSILTLFVHSLLFICRGFIFDDSRFTFCSGAPDNLKVWKLPEGNFMRNISGHNAIVNTLAINQDNVLVSAGMSIPIYSEMVWSLILLFSR